MFNNSDSSPLLATYRIRNHKDAPMESGICTDVVRIELSQGYVAIIDAADFERTATVELANGLTWSGRICDRKWNASVKSHTIYAKSAIGGFVELRLHRVVMNATRGQLVDHKNGNGLICTRDNLRVTDCGGNARNRQHVSGRDLPKGVDFHKQTGKYAARIRFERKLIHIGLFASPIDAAAAYDRKAIELFGEFACLNFPQPTNV